MASNWWVVVVSGSLFACGGDDASGGGSGSGSGGAAGSQSAPTPASKGAVPPRITSHPACVISADCPAGQHCDLGECVQQCNVDNACPQGATCSARARCLSSGQADTDPAPVTEREGTITVEPQSVLLTDRDTTLKLELSSDSSTPVRYRVELNAPHLGITSERGEFKSSTEITLDVGKTALTGKNIPGTIRIFSSLGNLVLDAPIKVGITGTYQGSLSYEGAGIALGSSQLVLDMLENNGDVTVQVDPERSLLFPQTKTGAISGRGAFTISGGVQFSLKQVLPAGFGGSMNHFGRAIGRDLRFRLQPRDRGTLEGTFEETLHGLFARPITLRGTAYFEHKPADREPAITVPADPVMPATVAGEVPSPTATFPGWTLQGCYDVPRNSVGPCTDVVSCSSKIDQAYYGPLALSLLQNHPGIADPLGDLAERCAQDSKITNASSAPRCALIPALGCALSSIEQNDQTSQAATRAFSRLYGHTLEPALLVAQDHVVKGLRQSFLSGVQAQSIHLDSARSMLAAPATWVLHPSLLDYLSRIPDMAVPPVEANGEASHHTALRTLARLFFVLSTIDGETSRIAAADRVKPKPERVRLAQERGVLTLIEAATVLGVLGSWAESAPLGVGTEFLGVLTPMDHGFASLVQGELRFGSPRDQRFMSPKVRSASSTFIQPIVREATFSSARERTDCQLSWN